MWCRCSLCVFEWHYPLWIHISKEWKCDEFFQVMVVELCHSGCSPSSGHSFFLPWGSVPCVHAVSSSCAQTDSGAVPGKRRVSGGLWWPRGCSLVIQSLSLEAEHWHVSESISSLQFSAEGKIEASEQIHSIYSTKSAFSFLPCFLPAAATTSPQSWAELFSALRTTKRNISCKRFQLQNLCVLHVLLRC